MMPLAFSADYSYNGKRPVALSRVVVFRQRTMIRSYSVRGKKVEVEQIPNVFVMKFSPEEVTKPRRQEPIALWRENAWEWADNMDISPSTRWLWEAAGWYVVRPTTKTASEHLPSPIAVGPLLRSHRGEWMIGTSRLTVRLRDELDEDEARRSLERHQLRVIRQLTFARHLYEVQIPEDSDSFDMAVELGENHDYAYAEPQLIRHLGGR
jgi:hypothetical protein